MEPKLLDLRRYAIDNRAEVRLGDSGSGREALINTRGQVKIQGEDKAFIIDDLIAAADWFEVAGQGKPRRLSRGEMAATVAEQFKQRGFATTHKDEDD
jgi:hypothetical protein